LMPEISPRFSSICNACWTERGEWIPNLWVIFQYRLLTLDMIRFRCLKTSLTHQAKAGSSTILLATAYSSTSTGFQAFNSLNGTHIVVPSFHSTHNFYPLVVFWRTSLPLYDLHNPGSFEIAVASLVRSMILLSNRNCCPSESTWEYRFSAITFTVYSATEPLGISISFSWVSRHTYLNCYSLAKHGIWWKKFYALRGRAAKT
jgi:hypothetical protein